MTRPRLVLDTNVLVSALVFPTGSTSWLRAAWQSGSEVDHWRAVPLRGTACP